MTGPYLRLLAIGWASRNHPWTRATSAVIGATFATMAVLGAAATELVQAREDGRIHARSPRIAAKPLPGGSSLSAGQVAVETVTYPLAGDTLTRVLVAAGGGKADVPPGLVRLPRPGEAFVSPALGLLVASGQGDPSVPLLKPSGSIRSEGLRTPDELLAYQGVALRDMASPRLVRSYGLVDEASSTGLSRHAGNTLLIFVLAPSLVLFTVAARAFARAREPQLRALRLVGASPRALRSLAAGDVALTSVVGGVIGAVTFNLLRRTIDRVPLIDHALFAADSRPSLTTHLTVVGLLPLFGGVMALLTTGRAAAPVVGLRPSLVSVKPHKAALIPLLLGTALLVTLTLRPALLSAGFLTTLLWTLAVLGVIAGLPMAMAGLVHTAASASAGVSTVAGMLGLRRLQRRPGGEARLSGALAAAIFVIGIGAAYSQFLPVPAEPQRLPSGALLVRVVGQSQTPLPATFRASALPGTQLSLPFTTLSSEEGKGSLPAVVVTCRQLDRLFGQSAPCPKVPTAVISEDAEPVPDALGGRLRIVGSATRQSLKISEEPLVIPATREAQIAGHILVPRNSLDRPRDLSASAYLATVSDMSAILRLRNHLARTAPSVIVTYPTDFEVVASSNQRAAAWLVLCVVASSLLLLSAFAIAAVDASESGQQSRASLHVVAATRSQIVRAHLYATTLPPLLATALGSALAVFAGRLLASSRGFAMPWDAFTWSTLGGLACSLLAGLVTKPPRRSADDFHSLR